VLAEGGFSKLAEGPRLYIRPFVRDDVERMQAWTPYEDLRFLSYNMPPGSRRQNDAWFERNVLRSGRQYFAAVRKADGSLIGVISLREIQRATHPTSARLGITLGSEHTGQGYGTEAMALFLDVFFTHLGFDLMKLDVAAFNGRAIRVYEKCGFRTVGRFYRSVGGAEYPPRKVGAQGEEVFVRYGGETFTLHYEMELSREAWRDQRHAVFRELEARYAPRHG
jgi:RimJ/RimL family protein N-acetyltransferase